MNWSVYKHTFPDDRVYIGITSLSPDDRWKEGFGYESQSKFFREIVKVGWDNIKHEIVASGLSEQSARKMERELIAQEADRVLNVQHRQGVDLSWSKGIVNVDVPSVRHRKLAKFNDIWLNKVRYDDTVPYRWEIGNENMELSYVTMNGNIVTHTVLQIPIPLNICYRDLYDYLEWKLDFDKKYTMVSQVQEVV